MSDERLNRGANVCEWAAGIAALVVVVMSLATRRYLGATWAALVILWCVIARLQRLRAEIWRHVAMRNERDV